MAVALQPRQGIDFPSDLEQSSSEDEHHVQGASGVDFPANLVNSDSSSDGEFNGTIKNLVFYANKSKNGGVGYPSDLEDGSDGETNVSKNQRRSHHRDVQAEKHVNKSGDVKKMKETGKHRRKMPSKKKVTTNIAGERSQPGFNKGGRTVHVRNCGQEFQHELENVELRINELKKGIERLELNQKEADNASKQHNNKSKKVTHEQDLVVLKGKVKELEDQKSAAQAGFEQAKLVYNINDNTVRKRRELFRLKSRLPALAKRREFEEAIKENKFVVVMGQTGSGKSTQLVQYVADMPQFQNQTVICTQPRKIAAISLAKRVAFEYMGGIETPEAVQWVGYHVGGQKRLHRNNRIQFMTESVLLNQLSTSEEAKKDLFANCCAIVVDEAHCRSLTTDIILGVLKREMSLWPHLKLIVTSATIDTALFSGFLFNCPIIEIPGRLYPVDVIYSPYDKARMSVIEASVKQALEICSHHTSGHVLCFLTGQNEVQIAKEKFLAGLRNPTNRPKKIVACVLYGKQTAEEQQKVFIQNEDEQKVIFSTDIAETSVTIDGVKFIIDCGLTKNVVFDRARNMANLKEMTISAASAEQRKGRAGRTGHGTCYRLYSEDDYNEMPKFDKAEIFQRPLAITFTILKAMGIDPFNFEWLENPEPGALEIALEELLLIGAIDHQQALTDLGKLISDLQVDPGIARMIQYGCQNDLGKLAATLAGLFSVSSTVFWRGGDDESIQASDESKKKFECVQGDILASLTVFNEWMDQRKKDKTLRSAKKWCVDNYINNKALNMALSTAKEIEDTLSKSAHHLWGNGQTREATSDEIRQLIAHALLLNVALKVNKNYVALRSNVMSYIHPSSSFFSKNEELPDVIVFQYILRTSKTFAVQLTPIDLEWIRQENGALYAFYEEKRLHVNVHEVKIEAVSPGILRDITGPGNRHLDDLNDKLDCFIQADFNENTLTAWCKFAARDFVRSQLEELVEIRKAKLRAEVQETAITGDTRIVWGCAGRGTQILRTGEFISIRISNVLPGRSASDFESELRKHVPQTLRIASVVLFSDPQKPGKKSARVLFNDSESASSAFQVWTKARKDLEFRPILSSAPSTFKEFAVWLDISFAVAPSHKTGLLMYDSMADANSMLSRVVPLLTQPLRPRANANPDPALPNYRDPLVVNGRFAEQPNPFKVKMRYGLYIPRLPANFFDEDDIKEALVEHQCPLPFYMRVNRGQEITIPTVPGISQEDQYLRYAISNNILPLAYKVKEKTVKKDNKKKTVAVHAKFESSDDLEMIFISGLHRVSHCGEPVRMKATYRTSIRIEKRFWPFRGDAIKQYLDSQNKKHFWYKIDSRSAANVWIHLEVNRVELLYNLRKKIDDLLKFSLYRNQRADLLFTSYGQERVNALDFEQGFIHVDVYSKMLRIYGDDDDQRQLKAKLDELVKELQTLEIDVPLYIKKSKRAKLGNDLDAYRNDGLRGKLRLVVNRMYVSGTKEGIEELKENLKDYLLEQRNEVTKLDCWLCMCPLEDPYCLQLCAHKFCAECIKSMLVNAQTIPYPIVCPAPNCGQDICLKDIQNIASSSAMEVIAQNAIKSLLDAEPSKYRQCFKTGCEQIFVTKKRVIAEEDEIRLGGDVIRCEQCNLDYCANCSVKMKVPVERHRGLNCSQVQRGVDKDARFHQLYILDEICMLRCPRCKVAFDDFDGCCALWCLAPGCRAAFCFFCLEDCGSDAHNHVRQCHRNPKKNEYYIEANKKNSVHKEARKAKIVKYLMSQCTDVQLRRELLDSLKKDLQDLEIVINPTEVGLSSSAPIALPQLAPRRDEQYVNPMADLNPLAERAPRLAQPQRRDEPFGNGLPNQVNVAPVAVNPRQAYYAIPNRQHEIDQVRPIAVPQRAPNAGVARYDDPAIYNQQLRRDVNAHFGNRLPNQVNAAPAAIDQREMARRQYQMEQAVINQQRLADRPGLAQPPRPQQPNGEDAHRAGRAGGQKKEKCTIL